MLDLLTFISNENLSLAKDYLRNKKQFQLHNLLTEQQHEKTLNLSEIAKENLNLALEQLFSVDEDISQKLNQIINEEKILNQLYEATDSIKKALINGNKIYFYGTGSTGRLAQTLESGIWRPFFQKNPDLLAKNFQLIEQVKGEITGGDRALISSLEGFEDLQIIGKLQLEQNKIQPEDLVFAITEGGETSAVIGTALAAVENKNKVWFVYNNPEEILFPFDRCQQILNNNKIQKLCLATGPQAITGSTRMQATTISLFILGVILETALKDYFHQKLKPIEERLKDFEKIQQKIASQTKKIEKWTNLEADTYLKKHKTTYLAGDCLMPVFVDITERSPTFRLAPLDKIKNEKEENKSWIQIKSNQNSIEEAWNNLLKRDFQGLEIEKCKKNFEENIEDSYLKEKALTSLKSAGKEQKNFYDLSFNFYKNSNLEFENNLGIILAYNDDELLITTHYKKFIKKYLAKEGKIIIILLKKENSQINNSYLSKLENLIEIDLSETEDFFGLDRTIALKMILNAHSTAIMAKLGRIVGNTMTAVQPGNLKLIGRATYLIKLHLNKESKQIGYKKANAVLFEAIEQRQKLNLDFPEVELAIVTLWEFLRNKTKNLDWQHSSEILKNIGLNKYLENIHQNK